MENLTGLFMKDDSGDYTACQAWSIASGTTLDGKQVPRLVDYAALR